MGQIVDSAAWTGRHPGQRFWPVSPGRYNEMVELAEYERREIRLLHGELTGVWAAAASSFDPLVEGYVGAPTDVSLTTDPRNGYHCVQIDKFQYSVYVALSTRELLAADRRHILAKTVTERIQRGLFRHIEAAFYGRI